MHADILGIVAPEVTWNTAKRIHVVFIDVRAVKREPHILLGAMLMPAAQVLRQLESAMGGGGRVATELVSGAGRGLVFRLLAPDSEAAVRAAAADWWSGARCCGRTAAHSWCGDPRLAGRPPADWHKAAGRLLEVL